MPLSDLLVVVLLGIVEGLTEFLPVSSTGHLILAGAVLGFNGAVSSTCDIVIQLGAFLAVIVLDWRRFWHVAAGLLGWKQGAVAFTRNILLGFLPSAVIGLFVYKMVKAMLDQPIIVAVMLIVGGVAILLIERAVKRPSVDTVEAMTPRPAPGIGIIHCLSMIHGASITEERRRGKK